MIGTTLGHCKILRLLGTGGMGEVYAAEDLTLGRTVAVKILPPAVASSADDLDRFEREAKAVAALNHSGIVTLHSFERSGDVRFITMELVEGDPLSARIPPGGMPFETLLRLGMEIADAVSAAHDRGIRPVLSAWDQPVDVQPSGSESRGPPAQHAAQKDTGLRDPGG